MSLVKAREYAERADKLTTVAFSEMTGVQATVLSNLAIAEALLSVARATQQIPERALEDEG